MKVCIILMIIMGLFCSMGFAQKKETMEELSNRVKILEGQKENLDKQGALQKEDLEKQVNVLKEKFDVKAKELYLIAEEIKLEQKKNNWIAIIMGVIGIGSIVSFFIFAKRYIKKKVKKLVNEVYKEKEREILELAKKQNEEFHLKETRSILVISKIPNDNPFIERFFKEMRFRNDNIKYETLNQVKDPEKYDLLLFDNEKQNIDHADLLAIMAKTKPENFFLYFGPDRFDGKEFKDRVNFANSRVQLYGNLINSLRYQSLLK